MQVVRTIPDLGELAGFLVQAKRSTYASGIPATKDPDGGKTHEFATGEFFYIDRYWGSLRDVGSEVVTWRGVAVWGMAYRGGMLAGAEEYSREAFAFLKGALRLVDRESPFRGPRLFEQEEWRYATWIVGDVSEFNGTEAIHLRGRAIYDRRFIGGLVRWRSTPSLGVP